jgi:hypothetical protein
VRVVGRVAAPRQDEVDQDHRPVPEGGRRGEGAVGWGGGGHAGQRGDRQRRPDPPRLDGPAVGEGHPRPVGAQLQAPGLGAQQHLRAGLRGGVGQGLPELPVAAPRVEEDALARAPAREDAGDQAARRARADPAPRLLARELGRLEAPELARVREVEALAEGRAEGGPQHLLEGVGPRGRAAEPEGGVAGRAGCHVERQPPGEVEGPQGEGDPAVGEPDAAAPGAQLEVVAQQPAELGQDPRLDRRVQAVAAQVDAHPGDGVAGRGPADAVGPLDQDHPVAGAGRPVRRPHPGGPGPQHNQVGGRRLYPPAGTAAPFAAAAG